MTVVQSGATAAQITLAPRRRVLLYAYSNEPVGGGGCETVGSAEITPPSDSEALSFPVSLTICGGQRPNRAVWAARRPDPVGRGA